MLVQLDHAADGGLILAAVAAGADSVLADGSALEPNANADFVAGVVRSLAGTGVTVEAELGALPGDEDDAGAAAGADAAAGMTDPLRVPEFLAASGADLLAVAVGNVHGNYRGEPKLDWKRVADVRAGAAGVPLVLHGASGLPETDLRAAAAAGIGKVNINTELRTSTLAAVERALPGLRAAGENMLGLQQAWTSSAGATAGWALSLLDAAPAGTGSSSS
ncbi:class II fructose-bisphosphate aldolase [Arthrobacter sp. ATA002]|uniref:class II fructose-bisphosphate aldolase n=1 Tax=Arthrobacter sp. ATA002 TaxID=2991715 RepID=UPI002E35C54C|nr:class II fructose-bisphosphate aldolase [Arthrobacter sp. ATA002]